MLPQRSCPLFSSHVRHTFLLCFTLSFQPMRSLPSMPTSNTSLPSPTTSDSINEKCPSSTETNAGGIPENSYYQIQTLNRESYIIPGDIRIGAVIEARDKPKTNSGKLCSSDINSSGSWILQYMEAMAFGVHLVNKNKDLLPNITLGLVMLDYCGTPSGSLAQSLSFLPRRKYTTKTSDSEVYGRCNSYGTTNASISSTLDPEGESLNQPNMDSVPHHDVVGVIGPFGSEQTIPMSYLYTAAKLPLMSYMATSDELSDIFHHRYFMRVVPPDIFQTQAMLQFIHRFGWSYISVVYQEGGYGENGFENIRTMAPSYNICIATSHRMGGLRSDYGYIVSQLLKYSNAKAVIIFSLDYEVRQLFDEIRRRNAIGRFIWIGSDGIADRPALYREYHDVITGAITFVYDSSPVETFFNYFENLTVQNTSNPWLKPFWEAERKCSFENKTCNAETNIGSDWTIKYSHGTSLAIDCILTFAIAVDKLLRDRCPQVHGESAWDCIDGETLLNYLLNTSFKGYTDQIEFDEKGDAVGKYQIKQVVYEKLTGSNNYSTQTPYGLGSKLQPIEVPIAMFEASDGRIVYSERDIIWEHLESDDGVTHLEDTPESFCSRPCLVGEYTIEKEVPCCWECRRCRDNEKLVDGNHRCTACSMFTWPDPSTGFKTCTPIAPAYPRFSDTLPAIQLCLGVAGIVITVIVSMAYVNFKNERVIKAASRELSFLQLVAILTGYIAVILCQIQPTKDTCGVLYFLFCLSFTWLYAPLLVKTIRIYRIFQSGSKHNNRIKFVSPQSQLILSGILITIQVVICIVVMGIYRPTAVKNQPIWTEKLVELSCNLSLPGLISFLSYNLVLVTLCSFFAFKTRKLPNNFNESRFISMCVSTTLIIWLAFVATFFTADRDLVRNLLLSVALLLNHTVALIFLFLPKIFAVIFLTIEVGPSESGTYQTGVNPRLATIQT